MFAPGIHAKFAQGWFKRVVEILRQSGASEFHFRLEDQLQFEQRKQKLGVINERFPRNQ